MKGWSHDEFARLTIIQSLRMLLLLLLLAAPAVAARDNFGTAAATALRSMPKYLALASMMLSLSFTFE